MRRASASASGDDVDEATIAAIVDEAKRVVERDVLDVANVLDRHGIRVAGSDSVESAEVWLDYFEPGDEDEIDDWCQIGIWDPAIAAACRDAGLTPEMVTEAELRLMERDEGSDPVYDACNGDMPVEELIAAVWEKRQS